ncbi:inositol monophosphatase family protein [Streptomyces mesophilus]|uniref:inositol monophosphatase family protein n=1 Tax=Streptomyces mesophilus TaxID=1775132 RepID=UPI003324F503
MTGAPRAPVDLPELLRLGSRAAAEAARAVTELTGGRRPLRTKSSPTDPVTAADVASDAALRARLVTERPYDGLLSEDGEDIASRNGVRWVADPLDGTVNHLHGIPHVAVSIACEVWTEGAWQAVIGVVHDVVRGHQFTAVRGGGSHRDGTALSVTDPVSRAQAVLVTEFDYLPAARRRQAAQIARIAPEVADIRATGSSALDLCWLAAGWVDGYFEDELARWDWAAGRLIVEEAGGVVTDFGTGVLAAGPQLHSSLRVLLTPGPPPSRSLPPVRHG